MRFLFALLAACAGTEPSGTDDDDAQTELLVQRCPDKGLTVLGLGDERVVPLDRPSPELVAVPPALSDRALVERWQRASDLADLGLPRAAATSLREASLMTSDRAARSALRSSPTPAALAADAAG